MLLSIAPHSKVLRNFLSISKRIIYILSTRRKSGLICLGRLIVKSAQNICDLINKFVYSSPGKEMLLAQAVGKYFSPCCIRSFILCIDRAWLTCNCGHETSSSSRDGESEIQVYSTSMQESQPMKHPKPNWPPRGNPH